MCRDYTLIPLPVEPSPSDERDYKLDQFMYLAPEEELTHEYKIPYIPSVREQGNTGMCMAFALASIKEYQEWKERGLRVRYSPGFIYAQKTFTSKEGMIARFDLGILRRNGVCAFSQFPSIGKYKTIKDKYDLLDDQIKKDAKKQRVKSYVRLDNEYEIKKALMEMGPVLLCINVYPSFYKTNSDGLVKEVGENENKQGGHAMTIVGWSVFNGRTYWNVLNSWGQDWGNNGFCMISTNYKGIMEVWGITDQRVDNSVLLLKVGSNTMYVNGEPIKLDQAPVVDNKSWRTLIPIRGPFEALGFDVKWYEDTQRILIIGSDEDD